MYKVLWLSRHPLGQVQIDDLDIDVGGNLDVTTVNMTYPAQSGEAVKAVVEASKGFDIVAGVFPAHIASALTLASARAPEEGVVSMYGIWREGRQMPLRVYVPVSMPVFAEDGQQRGFTHSHWERVA